MSVLTYKCQFDDFENNELSLFVFVEWEQVHAGTERL